MISLGIGFKRMLYCVHLTEGKYVYTKSITTLQLNLLYYQHFQQQN